MARSEAASPPASPQRGPGEAGALAGRPSPASAVWLFARALVRGSGLRRYRCPRAGRKVPLRSPFPAPPHKGPLAASPGNNARVLGKGAKPRQKAAPLSGFAGGAPRRLLRAACRPRRSRGGRRCPTRPGELLSGGSGHLVLRAGRWGEWGSGGGRLMARGQHRTARPRGRATILSGEAALPRGAGGREAPPGVGEQAAGPGRAASTGSEACGVGGRARCRRGSPQRVPAVGLCRWSEGPLGGGFVVMCVGISFWFFCSLFPLSFGGDRSGLGEKRNKGKHGNLPENERINQENVVGATGCPLLLPPGGGGGGGGLPWRSLPGAVVVRAGLVLLVLE